MTENLSENPHDTTHGDSIGGAESTVPYGQTEPLSTAVIDAVADAADVEPAELGASLYDQIDPDALDNLFSDRHNGIPRGSGHVVFSLLGYEITVYSDGHVVVRE
ncbi:HalOD1 output domain-containing protein [Halorussus amylolyticus]|uniref:HalOD1 output domain-containing protein n=1 Tax=Halorussus amylolyticus TaxID=1126242 RepID=UPI00138F6BEA|nr:HalOD1 output domain-containing protein [Halorussus amylolyticus]